MTQTKHYSYGDTVQVTGNLETGDIHIADKSKPARSVEQVMATKLTAKSITLGDLNVKA